MTRLQTVITVTIGAVLLVLIGQHFGVLDFFKVPPPAPIATDDFNSYLDGDLSSKSGGTGKWAGSWNATRFAVKAHEATRSAPESESYATRSFHNETPATKELFVSFDVRVAAAVQTSDSFSVELGYGVNNSSLTVAKLPGSNDIQFGQGGFVSSGFQLQSGRTQRIVACYDQDQQVVSLWVNPGSFAFYDASTGRSNANARKTGVSGLGDATRVTFTPSRPGYFFDNVVIADRANAVGIDFRTN